MIENFKEKIKIENIACKLLENITSEYSFPHQLTKNQEENLKYYNEYFKNFEKTLTEKQKKDFDNLSSINNCISASSLDSAIIYGVILKVAFDKILENPLEILELHERKKTLARDLYKPVGQED